MNTIEKIYKETVVNFTNNSDMLITAGQPYIQPGRDAPLVAMEEPIPGFKFAVVATQEGVTVLPDIVHNEAFNPNVEFTSHNIMRILGRWPAINMDMFRRSPIPAYTMIMTYFNKEILGNRYTDFPEEGLYVVDVIPHSEGKDAPLTAEQKGQFVKTIGLITLPIMYMGILTVAFSKIKHYANHGTISNSGMGTGVRVTFEPRTDLSVYFHDAEEEVRAKRSSDSPDSLARELGNFIVSPLNMITVFKNTNINPRKAHKKFTTALINYLKNNTGYFSEYHERAVLIDEHFSAKKFETIVLQEASGVVKDLAKQMKEFKDLQ